MQTIKTYPKAEEAYIAAGYLCSMGIEAVVSQDSPHSGSLLGVMESLNRLEVPESQIKQALELLEQHQAESSPPTQIAAAPVDSTRLLRFLRFILIYDTASYIIFAVFGHHLVGETPQPVTEYLASLAVSDSLWRFSFASYWPLFALGIASNILCYCCLPIGRTLFAITTVWGIVVQLGPPPMIFGPYLGFFGGIQGTLTSIALAIMYWSPLRDRFANRLDASSDATSGL